MQKRKTRKELSERVEKLGETFLDMADMWLIARMKFMRRLGLQPPEEKKD